MDYEVHMNNELKLSKNLTNNSLGDFFNYAVRDEKIDNIWKDKKNRKLLDKILVSPETSGKAKFLACEIFFKKVPQFLMRHKPEMIAEIYAEALKNNYTGHANSWGLLYEYGEGPVGIAFIRIGKKAIPALSKLLDYTEDYPMIFGGSRDATTGAIRKLRVKDFAAWYIGKIIIKEQKYYQDFSSRDNQINDLKQLLRVYR